MLMHFDDEAVRSALRWDDLIRAMESALTAFSSGHAVQPLRSWLTVEEGSRYLGVMPAATNDAMGLKLVSFYPRNAGTPVPTVMAIVLLMRPDTGEPIAFLDGNVLTAMRTAAVSAAVTNHLASPDSRVLALLGSGAAAKAHLEALSHVRKFDEVRIWSRTREHAERFAKEIGGEAMPAKAAVSDADAVVTATNSKTSVLAGSWLKSGCHVNAVGACRPDWRELDDDAMRNVVFVDSREAALKESGDIILSGATIAAELGEVLAEKVPARANETTIFKSLGMAVEDIAAALLVYRSATAS